MRKNNMQIRINNFTNHSMRKTNYNRSLGQEQNCKTKQINFGAVSMNHFRAACMDAKKIQPELMQMSEMLENNLFILLDGFVKSVLTSVDAELKKKTINAEQAKYITNLIDFSEKLNLKQSKHTYKFVESTERSPENGNLSIKNWEIFKFVGEGNKCIQIKFAKTTDKYNHRQQRIKENYYIFDIELTENGASTKLSDFYHNALTRLPSNNLNDISTYGNDVIGVNCDGVTGFLMDIFEHNNITNCFDLLLKLLNKTLPDFVTTNAHLQEVEKEIKANWLF